MGLVLWIDQNTFATGLIEKIFKKKNLPFYSLESAKDFVYLVEDLRPEVIVLDSKTVLENLEAFKAQFEASQALRSLPIIIIENAPELAFITNIKGEISRPFDPFDIPAKIKFII